MADLIPKEKLRRIYNERRVEFEGHARPENEFGPEIFFSPIGGYRDIPTLEENPRTLRVFDFEDGRSLIIGCEGKGDDYGLHCLLIDKTGKDLYADGYDLFVPRNQ